MMFVQYSRTSDIGAATGTTDGEAAVAALKALGVLPSVTTVSTWQDLSAASSAACIAYSNAWTSAAIAGGLAASAVGCYCEPGYPLTASQRYSELTLSRYWATAANDPNRIVEPRGVQVIQLWGSDRGEYSPAPGIPIDADVVQSDWENVYPVALVAA